MSEVAQPTTVLYANDRHLFFFGEMLSCASGALIATLTSTLAGVPAVGNERTQVFAAYISLSVQITPNTTISLNGGAPGVLTATPQISVTGGSALYSYARAPPSGSRASIANASSSTLAISAVVNWGDNFTETWTVTVTDLGGATGTGLVTINFSSPSADGVPDAGNRVPIQGRITSYLLPPRFRSHKRPISSRHIDYAATSDPLPVIYATDAGSLNNAPSYTWQFFDMVRIIEAQHLRIIVVGMEVASSSMSLPPVLPPPRSPAEKISLDVAHPSDGARRNFGRSDRSVLFCYTKNTCGAHPPIGAQPALAPEINCES